MRAVRAEARAGRAAVAIHRDGRVAVRGLPARSSRAAGQVEGNRVELTADDVRQLEIVWTAQWHRAPTQDELQGLVESRVREEILYREAPRSASSAAARSSSAGWRRWSSWPTTFRPCALLRSRSCAPGIRAIPPGSRILVVVPSGTCTFPRTAAGIVRRRTPRVRWPSSAARPPMHPRSRPSATRSCSRSTADRTPEQVAAIFGSRFARPCASCRSARGKGRSSRASVGIWCSSSATPGRVPAFDEIEAEIQAAWMEDQRSEARRRAFEAMKARYEVRLPAVSRAHPDLRTGCYRDAMNARSSSARAFEAMLTLVVLVLLGHAIHANAHEARPAYLALTETAPERFDLVWRTPVISGARLLVVLQLPDGATNVTKPSCTSCPIRSSSAVDRRARRPGRQAHGVCRLARHHH